MGFQASIGLYSLSLIASIFTYHSTFLGSTQIIYYFHICQIFKKNLILNVKIFKNPIKATKFEPTTSSMKY
jgi:hypothetical protein